MTAPASAATVHYSVAFSATGFSASAPVDPVTGSFDIIFDPALGHSNNTSGITLNTLNINLGSALGFNWNGSTLSVGGLANGVGAISPGTDDFWLVTTNFLTNAASMNFAHSQIGQNFFSTRITSVQAEPVTPVPLPAALVLFVSALAGFFGFSRLRERFRRPAIA